MISTSCQLQKVKIMWTSSVLDDCPALLVHSATLQFFAWAPSAFRYACPLREW